MKGNKMETTTKKIKDKLELAVASANIKDLSEFSFIGSRNKHGQYLCYYEYSADCWEKCKTEHTRPGSKTYDFFGAHSQQKILESLTKKPIAQSIKHIAAEFGIKIRLQSHNEHHHDKFDFNSDLFRKTGHVTLNA